MTSPGGGSVALISELRRRVSGAVVARDDPAYEHDRQLWNRDVQTRPLAIVHCASAAEVSGVVRTARDREHPLCVRSGGYDWAGRALRDDAVLIDLSPMRSVTVQGDVAVIGGGATLSDVVGAVEPHGRMTPLGTVGAIGYAGYATGGGYGPLLGQHGLACDNLVGAELVMCDGEIVHTNARHEPELFWAIRGGGGNFGVITALRVALHPRRSFRSGAIAFPIEQTADVLGGYAQLMADAPDELTADAGVMPSPDGGRLVLVSPTWSGDPGGGEEILRRLRSVGSAVMNDVADVSATAPLAAGTELLGPASWALGTRNLPALTPAAIDTLIEIASVDSPWVGLNMHHFHGAATRIPVGDTAFGQRAEHFQVQILTRGRPGDGEHREYARAASHALAAHALSGGYPNNLGSDDTEQIAASYGPNADRLLAAKHRYDPEEIFNAISLPTSP